MYPEMVYLELSLQSGVLYRDRAQCGVENLSEDERKSDCRELRSGAGSLAASLVELVGCGHLLMQCSS